MALEPVHACSVHILMENENKWLTLWITFYRWRTLSKMINPNFSFGIKLCLKDDDSTQWNSIPIDLTMISSLKEFLYWFGIFIFIFLSVKILWSLKIQYYSITKALVRFNFISDRNVRHRSSIMVNTESKDTFKQVSVDCRVGEEKKMKSFKQRCSALWCPCVIGLIFGSLLSGIALAIILTMYIQGKSKRWSDHWINRMEVTHHERKFRFKKIFNDSDVNDKYNKHDDDNDNDDDDNDDDDNND